MDVREAILPHLIAEGNTPDKKFLPGQNLKDVLTNDGATVYQLPDGTFEMYVQSLEKIDAKDPRYVAHYNIEGSVRFIDRLISEDGVKFEHRQRKVLVPDKDDPIDTQFYMLTVTYAPQGRVGLLGRCRVDAGYMELQYAFRKTALFGIEFDVLGSSGASLTTPIRLQFTSRTPWYFAITNGGCFIRVSITRIAR